MLKFMIMSALSMMLSGCGNDNYVYELHEIVEIEDGYVRGELVEGTGEGIFYSIKEMDDAGIKDIKIGDEIEFFWKKGDFENENWEEFNAKKMD